jgi:cysteine desulfurase
VKSVYFDYAAATPIDPKVFSAMKPYLTVKFHNPSAVYLAAKATRQDLENARSDVAACLGAKPREVIFTAGATEANNLAIQGTMRHFPDGELLVSAIEHESVLEPAKLYRHRQLPVSRDGLVDLNKLKNLIGPKTVLVSVGLVNHELGVIQPLREIAKILNQSSILLHVDASQAPNYLDLQVSRLGVDLLSLNGGKIYGPKQSGVLYVKTGVKLEPLILGGGQEFNLRSGTENLAGAAGLAAALKLSQHKRQSEAKRVSGLRELFIKELNRVVPTAVVNGSLKQVSPHIVSVTFPGQDNERLVMELDEAGVQAATGSACSAANTEPSHVLRAIGLPVDRARSTLRFSFGRQTTEPDIRRAVKLLHSLLF